MAKIPVEQKSGTPWWLWLLGLLLLVGILWWAIDAMSDDDDLADMDDDDMDELVEDRADAPVVTAEPLPTTGTLTSIAGILGVSDLSTLTGRNVDLDDMRVSGLQGDSTFWISSPDMNRKLFVVLENLGESEAGPGTGADGVYNIDEGEEIDLEGTITRLDPSDPDQWGLTQDQVQDLRTNKAYLRATVIDS